MKYSLTMGLGAVLALGACTSTPTHVDTGRIRASTFSFVDTGPKPAPSFADGREIVHPMVQRAIANTLAGRGVSHVPRGGDITVAYLIIVGNNASTTAIRDYFGYGEEASALQEKAQAAYTGSKNPNYFEAGTLLIDLIDSKSFKLLKRGYASRPILKNLPEDARAERIQEVVNEILQGTRFSR